MEVSSLEKLEVEVIWFQLYKYLLSTILLLGTVTVTVTTERLLFYFNKYIII